MMRHFTMNKEVFHLKVQICISLEVAVHIPESQVDVYIENLCGNSDIIFCRIKRTERDRTY